MITEMTNLWKILSLVLTLLCIGMGAINLFCGYRYYILLILIPGFVIGALSGGLLGYAIGGPLAALLTGIIFTLVGAWISYQSHSFGVFLTGATGGGVVGLMLGLLFATHFTAIWIIPFIAFLGVIGGILAVSLNKNIIIISTALQGAFAMVFGLAGLLKWWGIRWILNLIRGFHYAEMLHILILLTILSILLAIYGAYVQFKSENNYQPLVQY